MDIRDISSDELARLCATEGGTEEWGEFVRRFSRSIALSALRVGRVWGETSPAVIDDIVQDVFVKFCDDDRRILREFVPRHPESFPAFIKVVSAAAANDYFRKRNTTKRGGGVKEGEISELHGGAVQDSDWIERNLLLSEIDRLLETSGIASRDRMVFWFYYQQGMTAGSIASLPGISLSVKGVESVLHRLTALLKSHFHQPLVTPAGAKKIAQREGFSSAAAIESGEWL